MSNGEARNFSLQDIQMVQSLIERCLRLYMSESEVIDTLLHQAKIEPSFTEFVWRKLEAEYQDFFRAYNMRLIVKDQIFRFNQLLEKQVELMDQMNNAKVVPVPSPNGPDIHSKHEIPAYHSPRLAGLSINEENLLPKISATPNICTLGMTSLQPCVQLGRYDGSENVMLARGLNPGVRHGTIIKPEDGYVGNSVVFGLDNNLVEHHNPIGEVSISSFNGGESHSHGVTDSFLDLEMNSFGFMGQIPRNFNFSYLNSDFHNSADILGSYSRSPFIVPETNFVDSQIQGEQGELKKLDTVSEGFGCDGFGSQD